MGAVCCAAAKDRTIHHVSSNEIVHRNIRQSPSWSFKRDSRVGVTGEDSSVGPTRSDTQDVKSVHVSKGSSSNESNQTCNQPKSPLNLEPVKNLRSLFSDNPITRNTQEAKTESLQPLIPASLKQPPSTHTTSLLHASPQSPQSNPPSKRAHKEQPYFNNESCRLAWASLTKNGGQNSGSVSTDSQSCGVCSKQLSEESAWSSQKMVTRNDLSVVSVLICGHVYHSECLETVTHEIYKYDPVCPVCTFGEKQSLKLAVKSSKAEKGLKVRKMKMVRNQGVVTDSPKLKTSSSLKISSGKPFLKRHFSFGSSGSKFGSESRSVKMKGSFWGKSVRE